MEFTGIPTDTSALDNKASKQQAGQPQNRSRRQGAKPSGYMYMYIYVYIYIHVKIYVYIHSIHICHIVVSSCVVRTVADLSI